LTVCSTFFLLISPVFAATIGGTPPFLHQIWNIDVGVQLKENATEGMIFPVRELWINVGDTIIWHAASDEEHTVTFLRVGQKPPAINRHDPLQIDRQGGDHYDGRSYYNSGLLSNFPLEHKRDSMTYSLIFDVAGNFPYLSLLQPAMTGIVHVRSIGTLYPFTIHDYQQQAIDSITRVQGQGQLLATAARKYANNHYIIAGVGNSEVSDFLFTPSVVTIHAGETVIFQHADGIEPHTVTFGTSNRSNETPFGNPAAFDGFSPFNSGWLCAASYCTDSSYRVTFTRTGTFVLRDDLNRYTMTTRVVVLK
jgi:plastocyanin